MKNGGEKLHFWRKCTGKILRRRSERSGLVITFLNFVVRTAGGNREADGGKV